MSTRLGGNGGVIVNMSSMAAKLGGSNESTDYATAKGAIDSLTIGLAKELAGGRNSRQCRPAGPDRHRHPKGLRRRRPRGQVQASRPAAARRHGGGGGRSRDVAVLRSGFLLYRPASRRRRRPGTFTSSPSPRSFTGRGNPTGGSQVAYSALQFAKWQPRRPIGPAFAHCRVCPDQRQRLAVGRGADVRVPGGPHLPRGRPRPPVRHGPRRHRQIDAADLPQGADRRRDGDPGADGARRGERRRPDHPLLLRLPAAADPARRHPPQPQRPPHAPAQVPGHRRGVDGALRPDVGHRPVAAHQPRAAARAVRRLAAGAVRRPAPAAPRDQRCGGGRAPGVRPMADRSSSVSRRCARAPAPR